MADSDDEYYTIPIKDQRVFGAGLKRKRVPFVAASSSSTSDHGPKHLSNSGLSVAQKYLATVGLADHAARPRSAPPAIAEAAVGDSSVEDVTCNICKLPLHEAGKERLSVPHEASLAHQVCLEHSHGASHIDRTRKGYTFLQAYGWDADNRQGLGASGQGRLYPVRATEKRDTVGLGVDVKALKGTALTKMKQAKVAKMNAKQVREAEEKGRKRGEALQRMFNATEEVERYLGELG